MLWILLAIGGFGVVVVIFLTIFEVVFSYRNWFEIRGYIVKMVIFAGIGLIAFFGLDKISDLSYEVIENDEYNLVSLTDNNEISEINKSSLFYVHISIDTDDVYTFYYKMSSNGGIKRGKVDANCTIIYEKDNCIPHIVVHTIYKEIE